MPANAFHGLCTWMQKANLALQDGGVKHAHHASYAFYDLHAKTVHSERMPGPYPYTMLSILV
jgi:hypothetical protein